jgi:aminoglycoside/choline kinase family phosphotransferase
MIEFLPLQPRIVTLKTRMISSSSTASTSVVARSEDAMLREFLSAHNFADDSPIFALTPDASTRRYFRVNWKSGSAVVALYPEPFDPATQTFIEVTNLFADAQLPVPKILCVDAMRGVIVQEDLGDRQLRDALASATVDGRDNLIEQAVSIIARIQSVTDLAIANNTAASRLAFDTEKLTWEFDYFIEHYFGSLRRRPLGAEQAIELRDELIAIAAELSARPRVLCHRDFHASNLIVDATGELRIIDYQDARMGPATYDLVSLLLDRQHAPPSLAEVRERRLQLLDERRTLGLKHIDPEEFASEFRLMTVQRCLKAAGTFSYQTAVGNRGATYAEFIRPMFMIALQAAEWLNRFPLLQKTLKAELAA